MAEQQIVSSIEDLNDSELLEIYELSKTNTDASIGELIAFATERIASLGDFPSFTEQFNERLGKLLNNKN